MLCICYTKWVWYPGKGITVVDTTVVPRAGSPSLVMDIQVCIDLYLCDRTDHCFH